MALQQQHDSQDPASSRKALTGRKTVRTVRSVIEIWSNALVSAHFTQWGSINGVRLVGRISPLNSSEWHINLFHCWQEHRTNTPAPVGRWDWSRGSPSLIGKTHSLLVRCQINSVNEHVREVHTSCHEMKKEMFTNDGTIGDYMQGCT